MKLDLVPCPYVDNVWIELKPLIEKACQRPHASVDWVWLWQECRASRAFLLTNGQEGSLRAALIVRPEERPHGRVLALLAFCGRDMAEWVEDLKVHEHWTRFFNCERVTFSGPEAYRRIFPEAKVTGIIYEMELQNAPK